MQSNLNEILTLILDRQTVWDSLAKGFLRAVDELSDDDHARPSDYRRVAEIGLEIAQDRLRGIQLATAPFGPWPPCEDDREDVKQEYALIHALLESADEPDEPAETQARDRRGEES